MTTLRSRRKEKKNKRWRNLVRYHRRQRKSKVSFGDNEHQAIFRRIQEDINQALQDKIDRALFARFGSTFKVTG